MRFIEMIYKNVSVGLEWTSASSFHFFPLFTNGSWIQQQQLLCNLCHLLISDDRLGSSIKKLTNQDSPQLRINTDNVLRGLNNRDKADF